MKEKLYTLEIMDAVKAGDECPFCNLERTVEQNTLSFVLGSSYMESDTREQTDQQGFCRNHSRMMFQYGNQLGNAWMLKTRFHYMNQELKKQMAAYEAPKSSLFGRLKKSEGTESGLVRFMKEEDGHCYVCKRVSETYGRMLSTFIYLLDKEPEFANLLKESKGFCVHHFLDIVKACEADLSESKKAVIMPQLCELMSTNMDRIQADIDWFVEKQDYINKDADWKNSMDAVQRTMQKLSGGYPADPVFKKQG